MNKIMEGMTFKEARDIAEGTIEYDDHRIIRAAWQFLIDRNHIPHMDAWFRQTAKELIALGICWPRANRESYTRKKRNR